ncbi:MAG: type II toxin-antitoxin system VapC family toxin [Mariprofundaceae bacterium]
MISVDSNIIIRLITRDDDLQHRKAKALFEKNEVFITDTVILETVWMLSYAYQYNRSQICAALNCLFGLPNIHITQPKIIADTISWYEQGLDFADALHLSTSHSQKEFYTFDKKFTQKAKTLNLKPTVQIP